MIEKQQLKVSLFNDLNDPFELYAMELTDKNLRKDFREFKNRVANNLGLLCFSKNWSNPVLWSHYADRHRGVSLEFNISDELIHKVSYSQNRLILNVENIKKKLSNNILSEKDFYPLLNTKFKHWEYEKEVRVFVNLADCIKEKGLYFYKLGDKIKLNGIVQGSLCNIEIKEIEKRLSRGSQLKTIQARLAFTTFSVVRKKTVSEQTICGIA